MRERRAFRSARKSRRCRCRIACGNWRDWAASGEACPRPFGAARRPSQRAPATQATIPAVMKTPNVALVTGITGQDGAYLAEFLLDRGYVVHGIKRRTSLFNTDRIDHLYQDPHVSDRRFFLHHGDMTDASSLVRITQQVQPDEIYNLAAQSHVAVSFEEPEYTADADALGALRLLEAIRILGLKDRTRFYQASTSELYGLARETAQWLMLQQAEPEDFVIASGEQHSVRDFVNAAAKELDIRISWKGKGKDEQGYDQKNRRIVAVDPRYFRPAEVDSLLGDASKARKKLGWAPKVRYAELVAEMVREDLKEAQREELTKKHGFDTHNRHE